MRARALRLVVLAALATGAAAQETLEVPRLAGLVEGEVRAALQPGGADWTLAPLFEVGEPWRVVEHLRPQPGTRVPVGTPVRFEVVLAPLDVVRDWRAVPEVVGDRYGAARRKAYEASPLWWADPYRDGRILGQSPKAGSLRDPSSALEITVVYPSRMGPRVAAAVAVLLVGLVAVLAVRSSRSD